MKNDIVKITKNILGLIENGNYICTCGEKLELESTDSSQYGARATLACSSGDEGIHMTVTLSRYKKERNKQALVSGRDERSDNTSE